jgi:ABC-2 type transport system ATP-binding protein
MLEVDHLTRRYGTITAVDGLSFEVEPGRVTGFLGPNGAGKTTTLRMLLALVTPDSGTATIEDVRSRRARSAMVAGPATGNRQHRSRP